MNSREALQLDLILKTLKAVISYLVAEDYEGLDRENDIGHSIYLAVPCRKTN